MSCTVDFQLSVRASVCAAWACAMTHEEPRELNRRARLMSKTPVNVSGSARAA